GAAARRQPGVPGRRGGAGGAAGPRPRRAAAAPGAQSPAGGHHRHGRAGRRARRRRGARGQRPDSHGGGAMSRRVPSWLLPASVLVAIVLGLLPLPDALQPLRPYWLALVLAYWLIEHPDRAVLGLAFACGLLADLAFGSLLGAQALRQVAVGLIMQSFS